METTMTELTAIDILILPDATMITQATAWNERRPSSTCNPR